MPVYSPGRTPPPRGGGCVIAMMILSAVVSLALLGLVGALIWAGIDYLNRH
jgi:hypothetical protein